MFKFVLLFYVLFACPKRTKKDTPDSNRDRLSIDIQPDCRKQHCGADVQSSLYIMAMTVDCIDLVLAVYISDGGKAERFYCNGSLGDHCVYE
jgi:hypothetical protein